MINVNLLDVNSSNRALGTTLFFRARIVNVIVFTLGIPYFRTLAFLRRLAGNDPDLPGASVTNAKANFRLSIQLRFQDSRQTTGEFGTHSGVGFDLHRDLPCDRGASENQNREGAVRP